jgi:hypothetical protein
MRLIYPMVASLVMTISLAQAEQSTGTDWSEREACSRATAAAIIDMEMPETEEEYVILEEYYTQKECVCTDRTPEIPNRGSYDKSKRDHGRWTCTVNYYKTPGKW